MDLKIALYVRVSTERQAQQQTSDDQVSRLRAYAQERGWSVTEASVYRDEGYSGTRLNRPALDRLRDAVAQGMIDTILVTSPDRLARRYAYQVWLLEAFEQAGCTVIFLDRPPRGDPQDALLLQIRGAVAEYERTLIADRMRRGRLAKLQSGQLLPWARAPFGYRLDPQHPRDPAGVRVDEGEAAVVRQIFTWYVEEGLSLRAVGRRLMMAHIPSPSGKEHWNTSSVRKLLTNHAYRGIAYGNQQETVRAKRRRPLLKPASVDGTGTSMRQRAREEWIGVAVPPVIDADLFERAQEQVARNRDRSPRNTRHAYLLRRLVSCRRCSLAHRIWTNGRSAFYTCPGTSGDPLRGQAEACHASRIATHRLDAVVWDDLCRVLTDPTILVESLRRAQHGWLGDGPEMSRRHALQRRESELRRQIDRLVDAYAVGAVSLEDLQIRRARLDARIAEVQREAAALASACQQDERLEALAQGFETFRAALAHGLETADFARRRELVELLIERVVVDAPSIEIRYILPVGGVPSPDGELRSYHPGDIGRIDALDLNPPLLHRQTLLSLVGGQRSPGDRAGAPVDKGAGIGRILEDGQDRGGCRPLPDDIAEPIPTGQDEGLGIEVLQHFAGRPHPKEGSKDQLQPVLDFPVWVLGHPAQSIPHQSNRERQRQLTPLGFVEQAGRQSGTEGVQLILRQLPLQPQEQPTVGRSRVVDPIVVGNQAVLIAAEVEQGIPIGAVAGQPSDLVGEEDAHLSQRHLGHHILEALAMVGGTRRQTQVGIDGVHIVRPPPQGDGAFGEGVLQPLALLMGEHLVRAGLPDVDQGLARQVLGSDEVGGRHRSPHRGWMKVRRGWPGADRGTGGTRARRGGWAYGLPCLGQCEEVGHRVDRQLGRDPEPRRCQRSRRQREAQGHGLAVDHVDVGRAMQGSANRPDRELAPEEGMPRVDDLDLGYVLRGWVIEGGMKL